MNIRNTLLFQLPACELEAIAPRLVRVWLPADAQLLAIEGRSDYAYFPESVIVAVIAHGDNHRNCYIGLYGFEGFGSLTALLGVSTSPHDEVVQLAGYAYQITVTDLKELVGALPELRRRLHYYVHVFMMQVSYTAYANGNLRVEQRLVRWLLMYQDRLRANTIAITHQRLADMLGVRRSGITEALHVLEGNGLIRAQRGLIDILDRSRLLPLTAGSYGKPEAEYQRLI